MKTNKFIENSEKEAVDRLKKSFADRDAKYKEGNQLALSRRIFNVETTICTVELCIIDLLLQNDIDIEVLTNVTKKYNKLCEELDILNSYKTIFGID